ncbi:MCT family MFS transporter [Aspergillus clavatus NRRL 1]|uniref:MFS monocarboxylate transporter, putative n=1 Tax=Aspergillus clavatus (strain ATCC 1007 / CBS 513.65 / DSM 816 / NCTC 3887 / NRRL 1 / QM 1276 / 107) TaxID=344612 RepID=A1CRE8_ASPCL|nr:MFS monocarboxylate transporter, putative [Aspergillus clavatus NRRL 1]EAW08219.1 MFS monocarboxylate transporter, putative [Aspergillus clavatus NRRL 1]
MNANVNEKAVAPSPSANFSSHDGSNNRVPDAPNHASEERPLEEPTFDTGLVTWLQVLGSFFLFFNSWGMINTWGAFQSYYEQTLLSDVSSSTIAWIGSLQSFLLMLFGVVTGPLFDAGYFRALVIFGTIVLPFGLMMASISSQYWHLILSQGICIGLAAGCLFVPSVAILPQYFKRKRGLANGLAASGSSIGGVVYPIMFNQLQEKVGYAWATRALGFVAFGTCCFSLSLMRVRFLPTEKRKLVQLSAFTEPAFVMFGVAMFLGFLGFYNFLFYVQSFAIDTGIVDGNLGFYLLAMLNAGSTVGRIFPNFVADHAGPLNMLTPAATATAILAFAWIGVHNVPGIICLAVLYGLCSGGFVSLPPVVMVTLTKDIRDLGTRLGMIFSMTSIGLLIGTPIGGAILSDTHQYLGVQLFTACCLVTSAAIFAALRFSRTGFRLLVRA